MIALANLDEWIASYVKNYYPDINHISVDEKPDSIALVYDKKPKSGMVFGILSSKLLVIQKKKSPRLQPINGLEIISKLSSTVLMKKQNTT